MPDIYRGRKNYETLIWVGILAVSFAIFSYSIFGIFLAFFGENSWISKRFQQDLDGGKLNFPKVMWCNFNRINTTKAKELKLNETHLDYINRIFTYTLSDFYGWKKVQDNKKLEQEIAAFLDWQLNFGQNMSFVDLIDKLSHTCRGSLELAIFFGTKISDPCKNVTNLYLPEFGKCHLLQINQPFNVQEKASLDNSLKLVLNTNLQIYQSSALNTFWDSGFALFLMYEDEFQDAHNYSSWHNSWEFPTKWIALAPGFHNWISMWLVRKYAKLSGSNGFLQTRFNPPPCNENPNFRMINAFSYSEKICIIDCESHAILKLCGCLPVIWHMTSETVFDVCEPKDFKKCIQDHGADYLEEDETLENITTADLAFRASKNCRKQCRIACHSDQIMTDISISQFRTTNLPAVLPAMVLSNDSIVSSFATLQAQTDYMRDNFVAIDIFYESLIVQTTEWYPKMTGSELVSAVGGQLGLCAGISFITFIQLIWYCCHNSIARFRIRKKQLSENSSKNDHGPETIEMEQIPDST